MTAPTAPHPGTETHVNPTDTDPGSPQSDAELTRQLHALKERLREAEKVNQSLEGSVTAMRRRYWSGS